MSNNPQLEVPTTSEFASSSSTQNEPEPEPTLQSFTCFPNLPIELRLRIYRETFGKPNHVHLDGALIHIPQPGIYRDPWKRKGSLPLFLHVCRESQAEVLRFYRLVAQGEYDEDRKGPDLDVIDDFFYLDFGFSRRVTVPKAIWFSDRRDSAYITLDHDAKRSTLQLLQTLRDPSSPGQIIASTVRNLEIQIVLCYCICSGLMPSVSINEYHGQYIKDLLPFFSGIEKLCISCKPITILGHSTRASNKLRDHVLPGIKVWLEQEKSHFNNGKPPEVYFSPSLKDGGTVMPTPPLVPSPSTTGPNTT
ncbi:hypothetical protein VTL71DRAFT_793 [Oculimacula yallundae]|uniref:2EXR domain-containing protein n=1 Tax=Oculimacula yallundae TaxID=86028 RepID=A0ABR4D114_9HELO